MGKNRQYPRLGYETRHGKKKPCVVCGEPTRISVDIQWSWFRGDDDVARVCNDHRQDLSAVVRARGG
jgi:hypothetical protein